MERGVTLIRGQALAISIVIFRSRVCILYHGPWSSLGPHILYSARPFGFVEVCANVVLACLDIVCGTAVCDSNVLRNDKRPTINAQSSSCGKLLPVPYSALCRRAVPVLVLMRAGIAVFRLLATGMMLAVLSGFPLQLLDVMSVLGMVLQLLLLLCSLWDCS